MYPTSYSQEVTNAIWWARIAQMRLEEARVRKSLFATVAISLATISGSAIAADMPIYSKTPAPATYDWGGAYFGGHVGGGWSTTTYTDPGALSTLNNCCFMVSETSNTSGSTDTTNNSFLGGTQVGFMYQIGRLVVGSDFDWSKTSLNGTGTGNTFGPSGGGSSFGNETYSVKTNWTATSTATVGIARDRLMLYSKAGVAWANNNYGLNIAGANFGTPFAFGGTTSQTVTGWTVGVGLKWAIWDNWFASVEYDYLDFGSKAQNISGTFSAQPAQFNPNPNPGATFSPTFNQNISEVKVGLNYKFSPGFLFW
jgi:outer membrane immunogenic protein